MKKEILISSLTAIITGILIFSGITFFDDGKVDVEENAYFCKSENKIRLCDYGIGGTTRCYLNEEHNKWDYCSSGWELLLNEEQKINEVIQKRQWSCAPLPEGCKQIK